MTDTAYLVEKIGRERQPVVIIDDFSADPETLVSTSARLTFGPGGKHYPGIRAPASAAYLSERMGVLETIVRDVFDVTEGARLIECNYSLVTIKPKDLSPFQRLPHFDGTSPTQLALLHYLSDEAHGGTSFYRHRATGYETVTEDRLSHYTQVLHQEAEEAGLPPSRYHMGDNEQFERIHTVPAKRNRMVIYRSITLHSGDILQPEMLSDNPLFGRLTLNTFLIGK